MYLSNVQQYSTALHFDIIDIRIEINSKTIKKYKVVCAIFGKGMGIVYV